MASHELGVLKRAVVLQVRRDPRRPEGVVCELIAKACGLAASLDHRERLVPVKPVLGVAVPASIDRPEERPFALTKGLQVGL